MKKLKQFTFLSGLFFIWFLADGQEKETLAKQLGYPADAKLLIIHADDIGLSHSANTASIQAFEKNGITSGSIMVPCPWFFEFAEYYKEHQDLDIGVHITLTAEWNDYKWDGVLPSSEIPSLLTEDGYFYASSKEVAKNADPIEVGKEIRAQIERAIAFGINPTHLDTHMATVAATPEFIQEYIKAGIEYNIPVFIPSYLIQQTPQIQELTEPDQVFVDNLFMIPTSTAPTEWKKAYKQIIENVKPGLNLLIVHLAIDNAEMQAISKNHPDFGSAWRQRDYDCMVSDEFRELLDKNNIYPITWKEIKELRMK